MEKIDIEKLGIEFIGKHPISRIYNPQLANKTLAEKLNEVIDKLNKLESFTGDNLK